MFIPEVVYRITKISIAPISVNVYVCCWGLFYIFFFIKMEMSTNLIYNLFWYCLDLIFGKLHQSLGCTFFFKVLSWYRVFSAVNFWFCDSQTGLIAGMIVQLVVHLTRNSEIWVRNQVWSVFTSPSHLVPWLTL